MLICSRCKDSKLESDFYAKPKLARGYTYQCRACRSSYYRKRRFGPSRPKILAKERTRQPYYTRYARELRARDSNAKLLGQLRGRIGMAMRKQTQKKANGTTALIGCSIQELRAHLESQFKPGMSWENHGRRGWHIDHKRPCAAFNLSDPAQQRECFHFSNLQPLWALENKSKGAKIIA